MSATTTGIIAVTLGLVVFFWDARRSVPSRFSWRSLWFDLSSESGRAGFAGFVSAIVLIIGQSLARRYWGERAVDPFTYGFIGVVIAIRLIVEFDRWLAKKRAISDPR